MRTLIPVCSPIRLVRIAIAALAVQALVACTSVPPGITPVSPFELERYLGTWYEIARLDHSFERGLSDVSAEYRLNPDGSVAVINRGYDANEDTWQEAVGRALFVGDANTGSLKVSFFGPFYGGYHVAELDREAYRWALVVGPNRDYLWILARDRQLSSDVRDTLVATARAAGFDTAELIWVEHGRTDPAQPPR